MNKTFNELKNNMSDESKNIAHILATKLVKEYEIINPISNLIYKHQSEIIKYYNIEANYISNIEYSSKCITIYYDNNLIQYYKYIDMSKCLKYISGIDIYNKELVEYRVYLDNNERKNN